MHEEVTSVNKESTYDLRIFRHDLCGLMEIKIDIAERKKKHKKLHYAMSIRKTNGVLFYRCQTKCQVDM